MGKQRALDLEIADWRPTLEKVTWLALALLLVAIPHATRQPFWVSVAFVIFASWRLLPAPVTWAGLYYVLSGYCCLRWGQGEQGLAPWQMAVSSGGRQMLSASILFWSLERKHAS